MTCRSVIVVLACIAVASSARADGFLKKLGDAVQKPVQDAGHAIEKAAHDAGNTGQKAVQDTGHTLEKAAHDAGNTGQKAVQDTGHTLEKAAHDTGTAIEKAVHDIGYNLTAHPSDAKPDYPPYHVVLEADCPTIGKKRSWVDYLSKPTRGAAAVGVQFRSAKSLPDHDGLGTIDPAACYSVIFNPKNGYESYRTWSYSRMYQPEYNDMHMMHNLPGNPSKREINVDGVLLKFNRAGEIYDKRGRVAGTMVCYLSNECEQYKY